MATLRWLIGNKPVSHLTHEMQRMQYNPPNEENKIILNNFHEKREEGGSFKP